MYFLLRWARINKHVFWEQWVICALYQAADKAFCSHAAGWNSDLQTYLHPIEYNLYLLLGAENGEEGQTEACDDGCPQVHRSSGRREKTRGELASDGLPGVSLQGRGLICGGVLSP